MIQIFPNTTVAQLAQIIEDCRSTSDTEVYIRIESIRGKPCGFLVREPRIPVLRPLPSLAMKQAE